MSFFKQGMVLAAMAMLSAGCLQEAAPTVKYFRAHREERVAQLHRCTNEAAPSISSPACVNAREAERLESVGRLRDLPPAGLSGAAPTQSAEQKAGSQD